MAPVRTMTSYRKSSFIKKIVDSFFGQMASSMLTIFITFLIANLYGAKVMGEYYYVITIILMASIFVRLGMDNSLLYFIPRNGNMYNKMSFVVITLVTIPVIFIIYIFTDNQLLQTALPLILIVSVQELFFAILRAQEKIKQYFFIKLLFGHVIQIIFIGLSYYLSLFDSIDLLIIFYISNLVSLTAFLIYTRKSFSGFFISKKFIKYSIPTIFISFVGVLINRVDILMIGNMMPIHNVGLYQVATQIAFLISFSLVIFNIAFAPEISKLHSAGKINDIKQIYLRSTRLIFSLCLIIFLIVFFYC